MGLLPTLWGRRGARAAALAGLVALDAVGCGGGAGTFYDQNTAGNTTTATNGLEKKSAAEVLRAAAAALKAAKSVRMTMTGRQAGQPLRFEVRSQGASSRGTMAFEGLRFEGILVGGTSYMKGDRSSWMKAGASKRLAQMLAGRWVTGADDVVKLGGFTREEMAASLTKPDEPLKPQVEQATLDGEKVVVVSFRNGAKGYVANTGRPYPLRFDLLRGGRVVFTAYGSDFHITKPAGSIDITDLVR
jgi:hypothetical protein